MEHPIWPDHRRQCVDMVLTGTFPNIGSMRISRVCLALNRAANRKKLASMVALLACRGGVRTFAAACVAGERRWPAYRALWLPRRAAWRCWRIAGWLSVLC